MVHPMCDKYDKWIDGSNDRECTDIHAVHEFGDQTVRAEAPEWSQKLPEAAKYLQMSE